MLQPLTPCVALASYIIVSWETHRFGFTQESISSLAFAGAVVQSAGLVKNAAGEEAPFRSAGSPKNVSDNPVTLISVVRGTYGAETLSAYPGGLGTTRALIITMTPAISNPNIAG